MKIPAAIFVIFNSLWWCWFLVRDTADKVSATDTFGAFIIAAFGLYLMLRFSRVLVDASRLNLAERLVLFSMAASTLVSSIIVFYAAIYLHRGAISGGSPLVLDNWNAIYFSTVTFTTLGYGDIVPNESTKLIAAGEAVVGYLVFAAIAGTLIAIVFNPTSTNTGEDE